MKIGVKSVAKKEKTVLATCPYCGFNFVSDNNNGKNFLEECGVFRHCRDHRCAQSCVGAEYEGIGCMRCLRWNPFQNCWVHKRCYAEPSGGGAP